MKNPRYTALKTVTNRSRSSQKIENLEGSSDLFGALVFNRSVMQKMLPKDICKNLINAMEGKEKIKPEYADTIAMAMKEWAMSLGATHYSHWFQPLTGATAEKHDSFIEWTSSDKVIEKFSGSQLIQGEPDASSFPSGGLRSTYEARGYTGWDPTSPVFLWSGGDGLTLCIPSIFFSWTGDVLDTKIPLLRSERKLSDAVMRLLKLTGIEAAHVNTTLGCEQEYFVIDRAWRNLRPDLVMGGRSVFGASPPKGQQLQDHYFGAVKDRILAYMRDFEIAALKLGIPVKTRHNEVAPAQHEVAPVFERTSVAVDHNILLMELMRQIATKHDLSCLLHEKPFHDINGSGKHCNWSIATDTGINLLNPTDTPENNIHFILITAAILDAVHRHSALLRASIGSAANDFRLGGHEAPPAIISVYLGEELERILIDIENKGSHFRESRSKHYNLGIAISAEFLKDSTDRNRTSPFAFTGNKFEFRAVGSSANPSFPMTVLNTIVAESVNRVVNDLEVSLKGKKGKAELFEIAIEIARKYLKQARGIRFGGDNYSAEWVKEAKKRGLPVIEKSIDALDSLIKPGTIAAFEGVLTGAELKSRYEILLETYTHTETIEVNLMLDMFKTQVLPAAIKWQRELGDSIVSSGSGKASKGPQHTLLNDLTKVINESMLAAKALQESQHKANAQKTMEKRAQAYCYDVLPKGEKLREHVDQLENCVDDAVWILPKYREMLFIV
jgi:glutamine synthetase